MSIIKYAELSRKLGFSKSFIRDGKHYQFSEDIRELEKLIEIWLIKTKEKHKL